MPEYLSPGVYVEEIDAGPKPIEGVSTSTAGAAGMTLFGPTTGKPELVTSFNDFVRKFGGFIPDPKDDLYNKWANNPVDGGRWWQFPLAVKGFFDNGGQRLYVKRVFSGGAKAASADIGKGIVSEIIADAAADTATLKLRHLIGINKGTTLAVCPKADPKTVIGTFTVIKYDSASISVTLDKPLGAAIKANTAFCRISAELGDPSVPEKKTLTVEAKDRGECGNNVYVRVRPMLGSILTLLPDPATGGNQVRTTVKSATVTWVIQVDDTTGIANTNKIKIKGFDYEVKALNPGTKTFEVEGKPPDDVVAADESTGGKVGFKKTDGAAVAKVKGGAAVDDETVQLKEFDATKLDLTAEDVIKIGNDEYMVVSVTKNAGTNEGSVKIAPKLKAGAGDGDEIKKLTARILSAGTRRKIQLAKADGLKKGDTFTFVPTGKEFTVTEEPVNNTVTFSPAIPVGKDWESRNVRIKGPDPLVTTDVAVTGTFADWTANVESAADFKDEEHVVLNGEEYVIDEIDVAKNALKISSHTDAGNPWPSGTVARKLRPANTPGGTKVNARNAALLYKNAIVELDNGEKKEVSTVKSVAGDTVELNELLTQSYFEGHKMRVVEAEVSVRQEGPNGELLKQEDFVNLQLKDNKDLSFLVTTVKTLSSLLAAPTLGAGFPNDNSKLKDFANFPGALTGGWARLADGADSIELLSVDDFVGEDKGKGNRTGIQAFEDIDEISICLVPCIWSPVVHAGLIQHCEALKDRFAILDPKDNLSIEQIREFREPYDTKYAALYYPWVEVRDPLAKRNVEVAPSAHLAGVYARVDVERGVHKAPANEVVRGITKIAQEVTKREHDMLNPKNINVLRFFPGRGNRVWGARVITSDAAWKYINVRRLFIFVEESIDEGTQWVVFEPNDEPLWARVRATITNFLSSVWRSGALQGAKPDEAFFVKCDRTTMTQDDIDNGRLICVIGIAPVKPAEFVIFRIQQKTLENKVS
jgi:phage tail sheath protein FI